MSDSLKSYLTESFGVSLDSYDRVAASAERLSDAFRQIDRRAALLQAKVLKAFQKQEVASRHFSGSTGYGYGDEGRDKLSAVYADVFGADAAIVSPLMMSGTHAIAEALFGILRPGDTVLYITGEPYDTLRPVIQGGPGSLADFGVRSRSASLLENGFVDLDRTFAELRKDPAIRMVYLQRSTGYDLRPAFTAAELGEAIRAVKEQYPDVICMVDNCYGEFVCDQEPTALGADMMAGSLIKNPGGGLAPTGGYIAGREDLIRLVGGRYSAPGVGTEIGSYVPGYQAFYQGLFLAPHTVAQALKGVLLAADVFAQLGFEVSPTPDAVRGDITQTIIFNDPGALTAFVRGVQQAAPVDSHVVPCPWDMPGYDDPVIMAAGTFVQGASLEYTADGPMRPPYAAYLQGGLTYEHAFIATVLGSAALEHDQNHAAGS